jgi:hypothetical protein
MMYTVTSVAARGWARLQVFVHWELSRTNIRFFPQYVHMHVYTFVNEKKKRQYHMMTYSSVA